MTKIKPRNCNIVQLNLLTNFAETLIPMTYSGAKQYKHKFGKMLSAVNAAGTGPPRDALFWAMKWSSTNRRIKKKLILMEQDSSVSLTTLEKRIIKISGLSREGSYQKLLTPKKVFYLVNLNRNQGNQISLSDHDFYLKMFMDEFLKTEENDKGSSGNNPELLARRSWMSLSREEKQKFKAKFDKLCMTRSKKIADYLKSLEVKDNSPTICDIDLGDIPIEETEENVVNLRSISEDRSFNQNIEFDAADETCINPVHQRPVFHTIDNIEQPYSLSQDDTVEAQRIQTGVIDEPPQLPSVLSQDDIVEPQRYQPGTIDEPPQLPSVLTGEALYHMVNSDVNAEPWSSLTTQHRQQYQRAVLCLKKDYLRKYRSYLHSLPSVHLHQHIVETLREDIRI